MKSKLFTRLALAAAAVTLAGSASASSVHAVQFQFTGVTAVYDAQQSYTNLGLAEPIAGNFPTLRDTVVNGDQEFGNFAKGTPLSLIQIFVDYNDDGIFSAGELYGTLNTNIAVDFRLVLRNQCSATMVANCVGGVLGGGENTASSNNNYLNFGSAAGNAQVDTERSFFDLFTNTSGTSAWGLGLDTSQTAPVQVVFNSTTVVIQASLRGQIFSDPGSFNLPLTTAEGYPLKSVISLTDDIKFSLTLLNINATNIGTPSLSTATGSGPGNVTGLNYTPEPSSLALVGLALAGAGFVARRRRA